MSNRDKIALLHGLQSEAMEIINAYQAKRNEKPLWMPDDLLFPEGASGQRDRIDIYIKEAKKVPPEACIVFAYNGTTESGLPEFHRLIAGHLGDDTKDSWMVQWNGIWTAEEFRHDRALYLLSCLSQIVDGRELDRLQTTYTRNGFRPNWQQDPFRLLCYTSIQERATQYSHANMARLLKECGAVNLAKIPAMVSPEEFAHGRTYRELVGLLIERAPDETLVSCWEALRNFTMPGAATPGFGDFLYIAERIGVFGGIDLAEIVEELTGFWNLVSLTPQTADAALAQREILAYPMRTRKIGERRKERKSRTLTSSLLPNLNITV